VRAMQFPPSCLPFIDWRQTANTPPLPSPSSPAPIADARTRCAVQVLAEMEPVHLADLVGHEWIFVTMHDAVQHCVSRIAERVRNSRMPVCTRTAQRGGGGGGSITSTGLTK
jgi:hypothetical protein